VISSRSSWPLSQSLQTRSLHSFPTRRSSDLRSGSRRTAVKASSFLIEKSRWRSLIRVSSPFAFESSARALSEYLALAAASSASRSEEHTSELQSPCNLVCRLLLEKKNTHVQI